MHDDGKQRARYRTCDDHQGTPVHGVAIHPVRKTRSHHGKPAGSEKRPTYRESRRAVMRGLSFRSAFKPGEKRRVGRGRRNPIKKTH